MNLILLSSLVLFVVVCYSNGAPVETQAEAHKSASALRTGSAKRHRISSRHNSTFATKSYIDTHPRKRNYHKRHKLLRRRHRHKLVYPVQDRLQYFGGRTKAYLPLAKRNREDFEMTNGEVFEHGGVPDLRHKRAENLIPLKSEEFKHVNQRKKIQYFSKIGHGENAALRDDTEESEDGPRQYGWLSSEETAEKFQKEKEKEKKERKEREKEERKEREIEKSGNISPPAPPAPSTVDDQAINRLINDSSGYESDLEKENTRIEESLVAPQPYVSTMSKKGVDSNEGKGIDNNEIEGDNTKVEENIVAPSMESIKKEINFDEGKGTGSVDLVNVNYGGEKPEENEDKQSGAENPVTVDYTDQGKVEENEDVPIKEQSVAEKSSDDWYHLKNAPKYEDCEWDDEANACRSDISKVPLAKVPLSKVPLAKVPLAKVPLAKVPLAKVPPHLEEVKPKIVTKTKDSLRSATIIKDDKDVLAQNVLQQDKSTSGIVDNFLANEVKFMKHLGGQQLKKKDYCQENAAVRSCDNVDSDVNFILGHSQEKENYKSTPLNAQFQPKTTNIGKMERPIATERQKSLNINLKDGLIENELVNLSGTKVENSAKKQFTPDMTGKQKAFANNNQRFVDNDPMGRSVDKIIKDFEENKKDTEQKADTILTEYVKSDLTEKNSNKSTEESEDKQAERIPENKPEKVEENNQLSKKNDEKVGDGIEEKKETSNDGIEEKKEISSDGIEEKKGKSNDGIEGKKETSNDGIEGKKETSNDGIEGKKETSNAQNSSITDDFASQEGNFKFPDDKIVEDFMQKEEQTKYSDKKITEQFIEDKQGMVAMKLENNEPSDDHKKNKNRNYMSIQQNMQGFKSFDVGVAKQRKHKAKVTQEFDDDKQEIEKEAMKFENNESSEDIRKSKNVNYMNIQQNMQGFKSFDVGVAKQKKLKAKAREYLNEDKLIEDQILEKEAMKFENNEPTYDRRKNKNRNYMNSQQNMQGFKSFERGATKIRKKQRKNRNYMKMQQNAQGFKSFNIGTIMKQSKHKAQAMTNIKPQEDLKSMSSSQNFANHLKKIHILGMEPGFVNIEGPQNTALKYTHATNEEGLNRIEMFTQPATNVLPPHQVFPKTKNVTDFNSFSLINEYKMTDTTSGTGELRSKVLEARGKR